MASNNTTTVELELPLTCESSCKLRSVIHFSAVCGETAAAIHKNLVSVYGAKYMSEGVVRQWDEISVWEEMKCMIYHERGDLRLVNVRCDRQHS